MSNNILSFDLASREMAKVLLVRSDNLKDRVCYNVAELLKHPDTVVEVRKHRSGLPFEQVRVSVHNTKLKLGVMWDATWPEGCSVDLAQVRWLHVTTQDGYWSAEALGYRVAEETSMECTVRTFANMWEDARQYNLKGAVTADGHQIWFTY